MSYYLEEQILENQKVIMSGLTDLNTSVAALQAEWTKFLADLTGVLANTDSDVAVEAASKLVDAQTAAIAAEDTTITPPPAT